MGNRRNLVLPFGEGVEVSAKVLGGKGAALSELVRLGVPVPPGFTVTTTGARAFAETGRLPRRLGQQFERGINQLERNTGRRLGDSKNPLLLSVRSGAPVSMPGMMDTVLNVGLTPGTLSGLVDMAGERFAYDSYRRFLAMYGSVVQNVPRKCYDVELEAAKRSAGVKEDRELTAYALMQLCAKYQYLHFDVENGPRMQIQKAIIAVVRSWDGERARAYRVAHKIPNWLGTAINIQAMVFGNLDDNSGTGVVFSRNVATGVAGLYGEFLQNAQGEDVVAGIRTPHPISFVKAWNPRVYAELDGYVRMLEHHFNDVVEVEFTVERGVLYILQVRVAKRTPVAAASIATQFVWDKRWSKEKALKEVTDQQVSALHSVPAFDPESAALVIGEGLPASPGAVTGQVALTSAKAVEITRRGGKAILVRPDTSPDDFPGMLAAVGLVTKMGGITSHAAVVARGLGKPAIVGAELLKDLREGTIISIDGSLGLIVEGSQPLITTVHEKKVSIFLKWSQVGKPRLPDSRLDFTSIDCPVDARQLVCDFYLADAMAESAHNSALASEALQLKAQVHVRVAETLVGYLAVAVAGELRHNKTYSNSGELFPLVQKWGLIFSPERRPAQMSVVAKLKTATKPEQIEFFRLAALAFVSPGWRNPSLGGPKWSHIAETGWQFLTGALNHTVFSDHTFDLQHNNGTVFGKHPMIVSGGYVLELLNYKRRASNVLALKQEFRYSGFFSSEVSALWEKGLVSRIWDSSPVHTHT